jgi:chorismate dehydratase
MEKVRRVLLDPASRTSSALVRVLFERRWHRRAHFVLPGGNGLSGRAPDAELVIGDAGLVAERPGAVWQYDLGLAWDRFVHKPFVYAFWVARREADVGRITALLSAARDRGLAARPALAVRAQEELGIPLEVARRHLLEQVHYEFGPREQKGLLAFYQMAAEEGLAPEGGRLRFLPGAAV